MINEINLLAYFRVDIAVWLKIIEIFIYIIKKFIYYQYIISLIKRLEKQ